ncbi:4'-phosphopantetheinyl transferase superfamily protein [Psychroserpens sp. Hel_I_66]|uniref:4'-phosphopantetheinyl transferase family protein n=1 Tax=Psychroserpens sp. Hel_I_66 TaxID=1250004 RepID=UPI00068C7DD6|nr:4'-phosphopantetheinyl transferase superfamily protein [Psychroserpens sp. Hel_I_66]
MIGNDIVDLKYSPSNWKRPRFLDKVFTKNERSLILSSENEHQTIWLLWSMKEAAYKVHVQQFGERFFNPKRLVCELISEKNGLVKIEDNIYFTTSIITGDYLHTIAKLDKNKTSLSSIFYIEIVSHDVQSNALKKALLKSVSKTEQLPIKDLEIKKTVNGIPELFYEGYKLTLSVSLTHCGRFSGFAY